MSSTEGMEDARKSTIEEAFEEACASVWEHRNSDEYEPVRLQLYGLYKVAKEGKCTAPKPELVLGMSKPRLKWEAWMRASTFDKEEAMQQYVSTALSVVKRRGDAATNAAGRGASSPAGWGNGGGRAGGRESNRGSTGSSGGVDGDAGSGDGGGAAAGSDRSIGTLDKERTEQEKLIARLKKETEILETYLRKIHDEINNAAEGVGDPEGSMSGWLSKWRDREVYIWGTPKWEPRYFVLDGVSLTLTCYKSETAAEAESVMSLKRCVLRDEGTKTGKPPSRGKPAPVYHVFGLYLEGAMERGPDAGVLLRLSTDDADAAARWKSMLWKACSMEDGGWSEEGVDISEPDEAVDGASISHEDMPLPPPPPAVPPAAPFNRPLSRKSSWDVAGGGTSSLRILKSLSQRMQLDLEHHLSEQQDRVAAADAQAAGGEAQHRHHDEPKGLATASTGTHKRDHKAEPKKFSATGYPASRPMHKESEPSLLSREASAQNYRGLLNLMAILLLVTNSRLIAANLRRYGVLVSLPKITTPGDFADTPRLTGTLLLVVHVLWALSVEKMAMPRPGKEKGMLGGTEAPVLVLHGINLVLCLSISVAVTWVSGGAGGSPVFGFAYLFTATILWMKLISYAHANRDLRLAWRASAQAAKAKGEGPLHDNRGWEGEGTGKQNEGSIRNNRNFSSASVRSQSRGNTRSGSNSYPANIRLRNIIYFWFAPTLCYQLDYPMSEKIRYRYVFSLMVRLIIIAGAMSVISDQYILPTVHDFAHSDPAANWLISVERLLTLAVPNTYCWLLGFYAFFHITLNLLAELLRFGDRVFYRDWWNANTIESYWRLWNLPVHYWMVRHVYFPALRAGLSKNAASGLCFLLSAVFHELLVSVPFHMVKFYAFLAMIGNVPLVPLTKSLSKIWGNDQQVGNWIFWVLFCVVGQPMSLLLYYRDYCSEHSCSNPFLNE